MPKKVTLYMNDPESFTKLKDEVRHLWFLAHGESVSMSKAIILSLIALRDKLKSQDAFSNMPVRYHRTGWNRDSRDNK